MKSIAYCAPFAAIMVAFNVAGANTLTVDSVVTNGLFEPNSVAVDQNNNYYIADNASHRILKYVPDTGLLSAMAGQANLSGTNNGPGFLARFSSPKGAVLYRGGLVVADSGNHMLRFVSITGNVAIVSVFAGFTNAPGPPDNGSAQSVMFNNPSGLATDQTNLFIADTKNNAIRKLDANDEITTIASNLFEPAAVALGPNGKVYVADSRNNSIKFLEPQLDGSYVINDLAGSSQGVAGTNDSYFASEALYNSPAGLIWIGGDTGLLVSDTGNHSVRRIYLNPDLTSFYGQEIWSVETYAGTPGQPGFSDGLLASAKLNSPTYLAQDRAGGLLVVDSGNNALRRIQITPPLPPVTTPVIGYVTYVTNSLGSEVSQLVAITNSTFYNDVVIAISGEPNTVAYTYGPTPALFEPDTVPMPVPGVTGEFAQPYSDGMARTQVPGSIISPQPDVTIKAIGAADGRRPSDLVQARVQFKVAPPVITGNNPLSLTLLNSTEGAEMWYTIDDIGAATQVPQTNTFGPYLSGSTISLILTSTVTFRVQAFKPYYQPSKMVTKTLSMTNFAATKISFGFANGEASSDFVGAAGQWFYAPVTLSLLPGDTIYSLQFNVTVTNLNGAPSVAAGTYTFESMLLGAIPGSSPPAYAPIPPMMFNTYDIVYVGGEPVATNMVFTNLLVTNINYNLIGVGWLERAGRTNLYDTTKQDLITYSQAHDRMYSSSDGKVIVGAYSFQISENAASGDVYKIQIDRPSATSDGVATDVFIEAVSNGSLSAGPINAVKNVAVGQRKYLAGDVAPFRWFNAGDFGDNYLLNNDVIQVFQSAVYAVNTPPRSSDFFDAMDVSNGATNGLLDASEGSDLQINNVKLGDGQLNVDDVYVVFRRSLDPSLTNYVRFWKNGTRQAEPTNNVFRGSANLPAERFELKQADLPADIQAILNSTDPPSVLFTADDLLVKPGQVVQLPVRARISGRHPIRALLLNLTIDPLDDSPALTQPVEFTPAPGLGQPIMTDSRGPANYAAAWLRRSAPGLWGDTAIGALKLIIPNNAPESAAYRVRFKHISASPNGLGILPHHALDAVLSLSDRSTSSWNDAIPDSWRLRYFGSVNALLSDAMADADRDGVPNWAEFKAGTNPADARSALRIMSTLWRNAIAQQEPAGLVMQWFTMPNKSYLLESSPSLDNPSWTTLSSPPLSGTGQIIEFTDPAPDASTRFYRIRIAE